MSGAEPYAFGVAFEQAAPACNRNLTNGLYEGSQGGARPPIAGTPTADQTAATVAAERHRDDPPQGGFVARLLPRGRRRLAGGTGPAAKCRRLDRRLSG